MPVVGLSGRRCLASAATSSVNFCFSFTTLSLPLCSHSCWRLSLHVVTWSDATKIGLRLRPNARYPAPLWPRSTRKDHNYTRSSTRKGRYVHLARECSLADGSTSHLVRRLNGLHARSRRHSLGMRPRAT